MSTNSECVKLNILI